MGLLSDFGEIKNDRKCIEAMQLHVQSLRGNNHQKCVEIINKQVKKTGSVQRYFTREYIEMDETDYCREVLWVWSGYTNILDEPIYFQFTGEDNPVGAFVGTEKEILAWQYKKSLESGAKVSKEVLKKVFGSLENINEYIEAESNDDLHKAVKNIEGVTFSVEEEVVQAPEVSKSNAFIKTILNSLLIPNDWTEESLFHYFMQLSFRINHNIAGGRDCSNCLIYDSTHEHVMFNSGLLDKWGKYILIYSNVMNNEKYQGDMMFTGMRIVSSKAEMTSLGFNKKDLSRSLERISFVNNISELVFTADIDDFDLENYGRIKHCIEDRIDRFPEEIRGETADVIYTDICKAVEMAVILNKYDHNYIKPTYNRKTDCIEFIIPYHVNNNFQKRPELGLLISYINGYWQVVTVLEKDAVMKDIKLFSMYEAETF